MLKAKQTAAAAVRARPGGQAKNAAKSTRQKLVLLGGERPEAFRALEAKLSIPTHVGPGAIVARGQAASVIRRAVDPVKLRAGKLDIELPAGSAYLAVAKPEHLQAQLDQLFAFIKINRNGEEYAVDCPPDLARYVLANADLLPVQFISRTPVLRPDGSVLDRPGYDPATAILYAPDEAFPPIPNSPTQEDAAEALERLRRPFREFPFVTDYDRDAVVGEVLTLLTRHLVQRAPGFVHNAVEAGSGKTKLFDTVAIIALGTNATLLNADVLDDETELKKVLTTLTIAASPLVVFDNIARGAQITSPGLSNYLTATIYGDRLLGSNTEVKASTCTVIGMTGNAVEVAGDNTRRMIRIDLDAGVERPETREFTFDCEAEARRDSGELVVAALTILRAHALASWPTVPGRAALGTFEEWDHFVAGAIVFAGGADIITLLDKTRTADPERDDLAEILRMLVGIGATSPMKTGEIVKAVAKAMTEDANVLSTDRPADEWHALLCRMSRDGEPNPKRLGRYLSKNAGRITAGMKLISEFDKDAKVNRYSVGLVENDRGTGFTGFYGLSGSQSSYARENHNSHIDMCGEDGVFEKVGGGPALKNPVNPGNPVNGHQNGGDGRERIGDCAYCRDAAYADDAGTLAGGSFIHHRCTAAWAQSR